MGIERTNAEGYQDPTAYQALLSMEREAERKAAARGRIYRPLVYICSPYSGDTEANVLAARRYSRFAVERGCIPIAPHLLFTQFLDDSVPEERSLGLQFGNVLMGRCRELWVFGSRVSQGMGAEIDRARRKGCTIRRFTEECMEAAQ
jgi:hypothetical protein